MTEEEEEDKNKRVRPRERACGQKFNGLLFLMIEEFDGSFLIRVFLIERECVYTLNSLL